MESRQETHTLDLRFFLFQIDSVTLLKGFHWKQLLTEIEKNKQKSFVEVKNVTLFRNKDTAEFPDAVRLQASIEDLHFRLPNHSFFEIGRTIEMWLKNFSP